MVKAAQKAPEDRGCVRATYAAVAERLSLARLRLYASNSA